MATWSFRDFTRAQRTTIHPVRRIDLTGRNVLVIGASTGIGLGACKEYAAMKPTRLIMVCRTEESGRSALSAVTATGYDHAEVRPCELGSFASVKAFADSILSDNISVDILVYNAGCYLRQYTASEDGFELSMQVNHLSAALLAFLLLPQMLQVKDIEDIHPRIVLLSSEAILGRHGYIDEQLITNGKILETYNNARDRSFFLNRYTDTKLINALWARALSARLGPDSPLIVTRVMPGLCESGLFRYWRFPISLIWKAIVALYARTSQSGARIVVAASLFGHDNAPFKIEELRGTVVESCRIRPETDFIVSESGHKAEQIIWDETLSLLAHVDPRVTSIAERFLHGLP